jgi:hypothetical protein
VLANSWIPLAKRAKMWAKQEKSKYGGSPNIWATFIYCTGYNKLKTTLKVASINLLFWIGKYTRDISGNVHIPELIISQLWFYQLFICVPLYTLNKASLIIFFGLRIR